jgi:hypothetical protein
MRDIMLIIHFTGLAMGLGTSFANLFLGMASEKMEPEEAKKFRMNAMALSRMGHIGITLLIVSGLYLMTPYWSMLPEMPLLVSKLVLVAILVVLVIIITNMGNRIKKGDFSRAAMMPTLGKFTLFTAMLIVVVAVLVFH